MKRKEENDFNKASGDVGAIRVLNLNFELLQKFAIYITNNRYVRKDRRFYLFRRYFV